MKSPPFLVGRRPKTRPSAWRPPRWRSRRGCRAPRPPRPPPGRAARRPWRRSRPGRSTPGAARRARRSSRPRPSPSSAEIALAGLGSSPRAPCGRGVFYGRGRARGISSTCPRAPFAPRLARARPDRRRQAGSPAGSSRNRSAPDDRRSARRWR